jgi:hypothetical protein
MASATISIEHLKLVLAKSDVKTMSQELLGMPYVELRHLIYPRPRYKIFNIKKRDGTYRTIFEPRKKLKNIQEKILTYLYENSGPLKPCVHGFAKQKSIVTNARAHCHPRTSYLLNIDIADFFPSITFRRVRGVFRKQPFNFSYTTATVLAHICTYDNKLPQGAPTSPMLANLICRSLDRELIKIARRNLATYTRYCDDITFSFSVKAVEKLPSNICRFDSGILHLGEELEEIFAKNSFLLNSAKSRLSSRGHRLEVTGVTINKFPNVKRIFIDKVRGALHAWEKYGYDDAMKEWHLKPFTRQTRTRYLAPLQNMLWGKLLYIRMVRGENDRIYTRLAERYLQCCNTQRGKDSSFSFRPLSVLPVVRNFSDIADAVFVVEWAGEHDEFGLLAVEGTAFAYKNIGLITCDHIFTVRVEGESGHKEVDFDSVHGAELLIRDAKTLAFWKAKIICRDKGRDIALIQFEASEPPRHRYFMGLEIPIQQAQKGFLLGFPDYQKGKQLNNVPATVSSTYSRWGFRRIEIDKNIRKGNSGGPYIDKNYRVAGVAQEGSTQDFSSDRCLCITELDKWLTSISLA